MKPEDFQKLITKTGGIPYIRDTQITVWSIIKDCIDGMSDEQIVLKNSPDLTLDDFSAAFFYYMQNTLGFCDRVREETEIGW